MPGTLSKWLVVALVAVAVLVLAAGQFGLLQGQAPAGLGVRNGRLLAPSPTPNSVSSQAALHAGHPMQQAAMIEPLPLRGDARSAIARLRALIERLPRAVVVEQRDDYLYVRFTSRWLRFVDDAEFWVDRDAAVIQVRSASRIGRRDFGVNRARVERIRALLDDR